MSCAGCDDCSLVQIASASTPFEIHITVDPSTDKEKFFNVCMENDIKPLFIDNFGAANAPPVRDMMTRSIVKGSLEDAGDEVFRVAIALLDNGIMSIRSKVETVPWVYEKVKTFSKEANVPYFETHIETSIKNAAELTRVIKLAKKNGGYVSQNISKPNVCMITFRLDNVDDIEFKLYTKRIRKKLEDVGLEISREIIELTFHDDNKAHDDSWINGF